MKDTDYNTPPTQEDLQQLVQSLELLRDAMVEFSLFVKDTEFDEMFKTNKLSLPKVLKAS